LVFSATSPQEREGCVQNVERSGTVPFRLCHLDTATFRALCCSSLHPTDKVVEIGCSYGKATGLIAYALKDPTRVLGLDTSKEAVEAATAKYPQIRFARCDVMANPHIAYDLVQDLLKPKEQRVDEKERNDCKDGKIDSGEADDLVIFVDIGGNRELDAITNILPWIAAHLPRAPRLIVAKSQSLYSNVVSSSSSQSQAYDRAHVSRGGVSSAATKGEYFAENCHMGAMFQWEELLRKKSVSAPANSSSPIAATGKRKHGEAYATAENTCPLDHQHCHCCAERGHVARECSRFAPLK
jgi:hypothetical protein